MKDQKGMALVTLVLAIIVLLVLAAVAIYMVVGPEGVLTSSQNQNETSSENIINNNTTVPEVENNINQ